MDTSVTRALINIVILLGVALGLTVIVRLV
jgi:hypothetical protein